MSERSKEDIRGQFSDIQRRLFNKKSDKSLRVTSGDHGRKDQDNLFQLPPLPKARKSSHSEGPLLRSAMPILPVSKPTPTLGPESKGNDMNFVVGLSENLLSECRRLTAENQKYKSKLKATTDEVQVFKDEISKLKNTRSLQINNESDLKDKNWELETNLISLNEQVTFLEANKEKLLKSNQELLLNFNALQKENDDLVLKNRSINESYGTLKSSFSKDVNDLNQKVEELNDENDQLHSKLTSIQEAKDSGKISSESTGKALLTALSIGNDSEDETVDFDSLLLDSQPREIPISDPRNPDLEVETLRATLNHSNRTIAKLRSVLLKSRKEEQQLKTPLKLPPPKSNKKMKPSRDINQSSNRSSGMSPSKRNSRFLVLDEDSALPQFPIDSGNWEDFIGDGVQDTPSKPTKPFAGENSSLSDLESIQSKGIGITALQGEIPHLVQADSESDSETDEVPPSKKLTLSKEMTITLSRAQVEEYARDHKLVLLSSSEYDEIKEQNFASITNDKIVGISKERGLFVLSKQEYDDLLNEEEMKKKLESRGLVTLPSGELENLRESAFKYQDPSIEYISLKAKTKNLKLIEEEKLSELNKAFDSLQSPTEDYIVSNCPAYNLHPITNEQFGEYQKLIAEHDKPSKTYLTEKANNLGLIVTTTKFYDELSKSANEPSIEHITQKARERDLVALSSQDYNELSNPSFERLAHLADGLGSVVLSKESHNSLLNPPVDNIIEQAKSKNLVTVPEEEYKSLHNSLATPSLNYLVNKLTTHNHKAISDTEFDELNQLATSPSLERIIERAEAVDRIVIHKNDFDQLTRTANEPTLNQVKVQADRHNLVTLSKGEYTNLYKLANEPTVDEIQANAEARGYKVIPSNDLKHLEILANNPTIDHVQDKAKNLGYETIKEEDYQTLRQTANNPDLDHISSKAIELGSIVLSKAEYEHFNHLANSPTIDHLQSKAGELNHIVIEKTEYDNIYQKANSPDIAHLQMKAGEIENTVLSHKELLKLREAAESPSLHQLRENAKKLNYTLLDDSEYESLEKLANDPSLEHILSKAKLLGYEITPSQDYEILQRLADSPDLNHLQLKAKNHGHSLIEDVELSKLTALAHSPSIDQINEKASVHNLVTINKDKLLEVEKLANHPELEHLQDKAKSHLHILLPKEEYGDLQQRALSPTLTQIMASANKNECTVVKSDEYKSLIQTVEGPSKEFLEAKAKSYNCSLVGDEVLSVLEERVNSPSLEELRTNAAKLNHSIIETGALEELDKLAHSPEVAHVISKSKNLNLIPLTSDEHTLLMSLAHSPSIEHVQSTATAHGLVTLLKNDHQDLVRRLDQPTALFIQEKAKSCGLVALSEDEHRRLLKLADSPSIDHLISKSEQLGFVTLEKLKYLKLVEKLDSPSIEYIQEKAGIHNLVAIDKIAHLKLIQDYETPSVEYINEKAESHGLINLSKKEYESPSKEYVESKANLLGLIVLNKKDHQKLIESIDSPSKEYINQKAESLGLVTLNKDEHAAMVSNIENPSRSFLEDKSQRQGLIILSEKSYHETLNMVERPSIEYLESKASELDCVVLSSEIHRHNLDSIENPDVDYLKQKALKLNQVVLPTEEFDLLSQLARSPSIDQIKQKAGLLGCTLISKESHEQLLNTVNSPTAEHLSTKAKLVSCTLMKNQEYEELLKNANSPTVEQLKLRASQLGMEVVSSSELGTMRNLANNPEESHIEKMAIKRDLKVIPIADFKSLSKNANAPEYTHITKHAERLGFHVLELSEFKHLEERANQPNVDHIESKANELNPTDLTHLIERISKRAKNQGLFVLSHSDYDELHVRANRTLEDHVETSNMLLVEPSKLRELENTVDAPTLDYLKKKAVDHNCVIIESDELETLERLAKQSIEEKAMEQSLKVISLDEYDLMISLVENPTFAYLKEKAKKLEYSLVEASILEELESISNQSLEEKAKEAGMIVILESEYNRMQKIVDEPGIDYINEKAARLNQTVVDKKWLQSVEHSANQSIEEKANELNLKIMSHEEYNLMTKSIEDPTPEYLRLKAEKYEYSIIKSAQLEKLERPIELKAKDAGMRLLPDSEFETMMENIEKPTVQYLTAHAEKHGLELVSLAKLKSLQTYYEKNIYELGEEQGLKVLPKAEHAAIVAKVESPTVDYISEKAAITGHTIIPQTDYDSLVTSNKSPTLDYLKSKVSSHNHVIIPVEEHGDLVQSKNESLEDKASNVNKELVDKNHYRALTETFESPSREFLEEKAQKFDTVLIERSQLANLNQLVSEPLEDKAKSLGKLVVDEEEFTRMREQYEAPSVDFLEAKSSSLNFAMLKNEDLRALKEEVSNPSLTYLKEKALTLNHVLISNDRLDELHEKANKLPDEVAAAVSMRLVAVDEFERLTESAAETLEEKANKADMKLVSTSEFDSIMEKMNSPPVDFISHQAKLKGFSLIETEGLLDLKARADETLESRALSSNKKVMHDDEFNILHENAENPSLDHIKTKVGVHGHSVIETLLFDLLVHFKETSLEDRALEEGKKIVTNEEYESLISPTLDNLKQQAEGHDHAIISVAHYNQLQESVDESLESKAAKHKLTLLSTEEFDELKKKAIDPSLDELHDHAQKNEHIIVPIEEYEQLKQSTNESLEEKAAKKHLVLLSEVEYDDLENRTSRASLDELKEYVSAKDHVILPVAEHEYLKSILSEPPLEHVTNHASKLGHVVLLVTAYEEMKQQANATLEEKIRGTDLKLIPQSDYDDLLIRANKPSIREISEHAAFNGYIAIPIDEYDTIKEISETSLEDRAASDNKVVIGSAEYATLKKNHSNPSHDFLLRASSALGFTLIGTDALQSLKTEANKDVLSVAKKEGKLVVDQKEYEKLLQDKEELNNKNLALTAANEKAELVEHAKEMLSNTGLVVIPEGELTDLKAMKSEINRRFSRDSHDLFADANESFVLSQDELTASAAKLDLVVIPKSEYSELSKLDEERVSEFAKKQSLTLIPDLEILQMKQGLAERDTQLFNLRSTEREITKEIIIEKLGDFDLVLLEKDEYQNLKSLSIQSPETLSEEELKEEASKKGMTIISSDQYAKYGKLSEMVQDKGQFATVGRNLGLLCIPVSEYVTTTSSSEPDADNVKVIPTSYYQQLLKFKSLSIDRVSDDIFRKYAEKKGYNHEDDNVTPVMGQPATFKDLITQTPPEGVLSDHANKFTPPMTAMKDTPPSTGSRGSRNSGRITASDSVLSNLSRHSLTDSIQTAGILSIATNVSLTDKAMIPAITQVVIGEYLFKYYRRLGPFSAITESRHERYFWVHPYTLTLYWSESNPVLSNPSSVRTRAAAIVSVESVEDNNPLPTGLYYKSIIVRSPDKSIKITCATRQRHNIWYNALRYLLGRNVDDLTFDTENEVTEDKDDISLLSRVRKNEPLFDTGERHAYPRQRISSSPSMLRSPSSNRMSRFNSLRRN